MKRLLDFMATRENIDRLSIGVASFLAGMLFCLCLYTVFEAVRD